ncbi:MAG: glycosyltransferase family 2 protein [Gammaproteobacteria bacterium]|nr:glycosyltransferase family 2 protein [Gammaproteobacteria bacterium]MDH3465113.1 glycosyltransferase family 2 protein [Gammaproteobacteria bacterium]
MITDLVTTIIPVFNRSALLKDAVESVVQQNYRPIEIIIVDDGSTDDSLKQARALQKDHPEITAIIRQNNAGPGTAREKGRQQARGEFIQYLDSDDLLLPDKFKRQVDGLKTNPNCGVSYGKTCFANGFDPPDFVPLKRTGSKVATMFPAFLQSRWWSTSTPMYRKSITDRAGPWTSLRNEEDWEYDCRIGSQQIALHYCDDFVSVKRQFPDGLSRNGDSDPRKLRDRTAAHKLIYNHARTADIDHDVYEMRHFAREVFLLARQCGAANLPTESRDLFALAKQASGPNRTRSWDFVLYYALARTCGWRTAGRLACWSDRFRA